MSLSQVVALAKGSVYESLPVVVLVEPLPAKSSARGISFYIDGNKGH